VEEDLINRKAKEEAEKKLEKEKKKLARFESNYI